VGNLILSLELEYLAEINSKCVSTISAPDAERYFLTL